MNKESFLSSLEKRLMVLEEQERSDILVEYSQHIDMKVASGLTEEEAIKDFGKLEDLTDEILEAYHVDPDYAENEQKVQIREKLDDMGQKMSQTVTRSGHGLVAFIRKTASGIRRRMKRLVSSVRLWAGSHLAHYKRGDTDVRKERGDRSGWKNRLGDYCLYMGRITAELLHLAVWLIWIAVLLGLMILPIGFGLMMLFGLAILVTLAVQGYPVIGITIGCLGLVCCCIAIVGFLCSLWRKRPGRRVIENTAKEQEVLG